MRRVIFNQKGGVGKSTITCNLAAVSAAMGHPTLVVDLDPQCNSTHYLLGQRSSDVSNNLADYFEQLLIYNYDKEGIENFIHLSPYDNLYVLPASARLEDLRDKLEARYKMFKLREELQKLGAYHSVYIDTPPAYNFYTRSALIAADSCLIPFDCDDFSRRALYALLDNVEEIRTDHNPDLKIEGIIVNQFQARAVLPQKIVSELRGERMPVIDAFISSSVKIRESHQVARPMIHFLPKHKLTREFKALYQIIG